MPLEGLRWSRDSGSALCDTSQNSRSRTGWGGWKNDENPVKLNANVCIAMQNVWGHKTCGYGISAWYIENKKRGCKLHTFAYEILYFDEFLFCDWRNERPGKSGFWGLFQNFHHLLQTSIHSRKQKLSFLIHCLLDECTIVTCHHLAKASWVMACGQLSSPCRILLPFLAVPWQGCDSP